MAAIISGLNSPPIRRLKRTWEQVSGRFMSQLGTCEMTLDSSKNFTNYKATLAQVNPPCIPFIGVFQTVSVSFYNADKCCYRCLFDYPYIHSRWQQRYATGQPYQLRQASTSGGDYPRDTALAIKGLQPRAVAPYPRIYRRSAWRVQ